MFEEIENVVNEETGEIMNTSYLSYEVVEDTEDYTIIRDLETGKFSKKVKYSRIQTTVPETEDEIMQLYLIMTTEDSDVITPLKMMNKKTISVSDFYTEPYTAVNEDSGMLEYGVVTYIKDVDGNFYATSGKSVYFTLTNFYNTFSLEKPIDIKISTVKQTKGEQIKATVLGYTK